MLSMLFLQTETSETPTKELRYKIRLLRSSHLRKHSISTLLSFTHLICCSPKRSWLGLQQSTATVVVVTMKHWSSRPWREWRRAAKYRPWISWKQTLAYPRSQQVESPDKQLWRAEELRKAGRALAAAPSMPILRKTSRQKKKKSEWGWCCLSEEVLHKAPKQELIHKHCSDL